MLYLCYPTKLLWKFDIFFHLRSLKCIVTVCPIKFIIRPLKSIHKIGGQGAGSKNVEFSPYTSTEEMQQRYILYLGLVKNL